MQSRKHTPSVQSDEFDATGQMGVAPGAPGVGHPFGAAHLQGTLGNSCLAERLAQMSTSSRAEKGQWPATAGRPAGTSGYPFMAQIASSFGAEHDLSDIETEVGTGKARAGAQSLGSDAYVADGMVGFAGRPDLWTAAHEAAHVVQQRGGAQLPGGAGRYGDRFEKEADAVADRVVKGDPVGDLLAPWAGGTASMSGVQREADSPSQGASASPSKVVAVEHRTATINLVDLDLIWDDPLGHIELDLDVKKFADGHVEVSNVDVRQELISAANRSMTVRVRSKSPTVADDFVDVNFTVDVAERPVGLALSTSDTVEAGGGLKGGPISINGGVSSEVGIQTTYTMEGNASIVRIFRFTGSPQADTNPPVTPGPLADVNDAGVCAAPALNDDNQSIGNSGSSSTVPSPKATESVDPTIHMSLVKSNDIEEGELNILAPSFLESNLDVVSTGGKTMDP